MTDPLAQTIKVMPGYDRRAQNESYHGCEIVFILRGNRGVLVFASVTDWFPKNVQEQYMNGIQRTNVIGVQPKPAEFVWHSFEPTKLPHPVQHTDCPYSTNGVCYTSNSIHTAEYLRDVLIKEGSEGVWREMAQRYRSSANISQVARR